MIRYIIGKKKTIKKNRLKRDNLQKDEKSENTRESNGRKMLEKCKFLNEKNMACWK